MKYECYGVLRVTGHVVFCSGGYGALWWVIMPHMGHHKTHITKRPFADGQLNAKQISNACMKQVSKGSRTRAKWNVYLQRAHQEIMHHNTVYLTGNIWDMEPQSPCMKQEQHQADCKGSFR